MTLHDQAGRHAVPPSFDTDVTRQQLAGAHHPDVGPEGPVRVRHGEELPVLGAGRSGSGQIRSDVVVAPTGERAVRVLHDGDPDHVQEPHREHQRPQHIVGDAVRAIPTLRGQS